ncbi:hypothetical protein [Aureimonas leprariae]|uniref:PASTA domain-containing protein n=1 Tax=Plantimonas leprariae TaxID=2615207 RepID=A0A7V7TXH2_9HYPH|nr:hypothetical protein [Aureimonas leprariae]KAB0681341.1 hypothetical protein F6X38_05500 [Aureimonas leprariae]
MPTFEFADCPTRLDLPQASTGEQTGSVTCTVRNTQGGRQAGRIRVKPEGEAKPEWFSIAGAPPTSPLELEQEFAAGSAASVTVHLRVPAGAPAGPQTFKLLVLSEQQPDTDFAVGPSIGFTVAAPAVPPPKPKVPRWIFAVLAVVVLAMIGGAAALFWPKGALDPQLVAGHSLADAQKIAAENGYPDIGSRPGDPAGYDPGTVTGVADDPDGKPVLLTDPGVTIPAGLRGQNVVAVAQQLADIGLRVSPGEAHEAGLDNNVIASVAPPEGTVVKLGETVQVAVNQKPAASGGGGGVVVGPVVNICKTNPQICNLPIRQQFLRRIERSTATMKQLGQ